ELEVGASTDAFGEARRLDQRRRALVQGHHRVARLEREAVPVPLDQTGRAQTNSSSITRIARGGVRSTSSPSIAFSAAAKRDSRHLWITITNRVSSPVPR